MKIGIVGYGNLGKAVENLASQNDGIEIVGIFSRRKVSANFPVYDISDAVKFKGLIDIMFMCGGSDKDLLLQTPMFAKNFNTIDSFDTHPKILSHYKKVNEICIANKTTSIVCAGWDPGLFSCLRVLLGPIFQNVNCFYGEGISLGHTNALKKIGGIIDAKQYTIPCKKALKCAYRGKKMPAHIHLRKCFIVTNQNHKKIRQKICAIPHYFKGEKIKIKFVNQETLNKKHNKLFHKGKIICTNENASLTLDLKMKSNPIFTASIMIAYAFALEKIANSKVFKAFTPLQIPVSWLSNKNENQTIKDYC